MNPMTNVKNVKKLSDLELKRNLKTSWHDQYKDSAWVFVGGLPYDLTEGDIICVFSQYGEVVNLNLVRDKVTGKSKGFCFLCYEDQRSTVLAVDNLNAMKLLGRTIRVDHASNYKPPEDLEKLDEATRKLVSEGCASIPATATDVQVKEESVKIKKEKKDKSKIKSRKEKKKKKRKKKRKQVSSSEDSSDSSESDSESESTDSGDNCEEVNQKSKKRKHKKNVKKHKKKSKADTSDSESSVENETIRDSREKRRLLVEKIKTLEAVLNHKVKKANENGENRNKDKRSSGSEGSVDYRDKQKNHYYQNGTAEHDDRRNAPGTSRTYTHERNRERDYERSRDKEHVSRDRDRDKRWERSHDRYRR